MERKIKDLTPGQSAWTVPWGLHEAQGKKWLHPNYSAYSVPGGTVEMKVTALAPTGQQDKRYFVHTGRDGIIVGLAPFGGPEKPRETKDDSCRPCERDAGHERKLWILERKIASATDPELRRALEDRWHELADPGVDHETWLEYHDRLVREYYDFDAEWALIKEICPEMEKAAPAPKKIKQPLPRHIRLARLWAAMFAVWTVVSLVVLDWPSTAVIAAMWTGVFFTMDRYWSRRI